MVKKREIDCRADSIAIARLGNESPLVQQEMLLVLLFQILSNLRSSCDYPSARIGNLVRSKGKGDPISRHWFETENHCRCSDPHNPNRTDARSSRRSQDQIELCLRRADSTVHWTYLCGCADHLQYERAMENRWPVAWLLRRGPTHVLYLV